MDKIIVLSETCFCMMKGRGVLHNISQEWLCRRHFWFPHLLWRAGLQRFAEPTDAAGRSRRGMVKVLCSRCTELEELLAGGPKPEMTIFGGLSTTLKVNQESVELTRANKRKGRDRIEKERNKSSLLKMAVGKASTVILRLAACVKKLLKC